MLEKCIFRNTNIRVTILDTYMGKKLFIENIDTALKEVLKCDTNIGRRMLWSFHKYMEDRFAQEQLDFLIVIAVLNNILDNNNVNKNAEQLATHILQIMNTYVENDGAKCINVSGTQRAILCRIKRQLVSEITIEKERREKDSLSLPNTNELDDEKDQQKNNIINELPSLKNQKSSTSLIKYRVGTYKSGLNITQENIFHAAHLSVWRIVQPHFTQFVLRSFEPTKKKHRFNVRIPFVLTDKWELIWDEQLIKQTSLMDLKDTVPKSPTSLLEQNTDDKNNKSQNYGIQNKGNDNIQEADSLRTMTLRQIQMSDMSKIIINEQEEL